MNNFPEELDRGNGLRVIIDRTRLLLALREPPIEEEIKNLLQGIGFEFERVPGDEKNKGRTPTMQHINRNLCEIVNYGLASCPRIDLTECYCIDLNVQHDFDISSSPLHIRLLHLIKAKFCPLQY